MLLKKLLTGGYVTRKREIEQELSEMTYKNMFIPLFFKIIFY